MNYFEFYNLPVSLTVDEADLKRKFYEKSKQYHPDFFTLDDVEKQMESLEQSTLNNTAYKTLIDFDKRLHYILKLYDVLAEEGKNAIPQDFLMEMMEINESVMELQFDFESSAYDKILQELEQSKQDLRHHIDDLMTKPVKDMTSEELVRLREFYLKSKYLIRLEENLKKLKP